MTASATRKLAPSPAAAHRAACTSAVPAPDPRDPAANLRKVDLFGIQVNLVDRQQTLDAIMHWARERRPALVDFMGVHGLTHAQRHADYKRRLNEFDLVACDGQPVRWALNHWYGANIPERVYGPTMTLEVCRAAAEQDVAVYFYGSRVEVLDQLTARLSKMFPNLKIAGAESPPFRRLSTAERFETIARINASGAGVVFLGLGCPKQEEFATDCRGRIHAVQLCVGAAFDLHAGMAKMAPRWMQNAGLEWFYRLCKEPRRLWRRYLVGNTMFLRMCLAKTLFGNRQET
jgi:N-acetylglucosaminyldiphosphoundecaprenol N-acetyl-beta-D-mannosaminyltransferase